MDWAVLNYQKTYIYDIGCSTATTLHMLGKHFPCRAKLVGIESSKPMIEKALEKLQALDEKHEIKIIESLANKVDYHNASVVIMNYTLQFIPLEDRSDLLRKIYNGLVDGGVLYLSEKVRSSDPQLQEKITQIYHNFKCRRGYSRTGWSAKNSGTSFILLLWKSR